MCMLYCYVYASCLLFSSRNEIKFYKYLQTIRVQQYTVIILSFSLPFALTEKCTKPKAIKQPLMPPLLLLQSVTKRETETTRGVQAKWTMCDAHMYWSSLFPTSSVSRYCYCYYVAITTVYNMHHTHSWLEFGIYSLYRHVYSLSIRRFQKAFG